MSGGLLERKGRKLMDGIDDPGMFASNVLPTFLFGYLQVLAFSLSHSCLKSGELGWIHNTEGVRPAIL